MADELDLEGAESHSDKLRDGIVKKRLTLPDKKKMRNLIQYRGMSDDEYNEIFEKKTLGITTSKEFEERISKKISEFSVDYDLDDLNSNDKLTLRTLAQAYINLEDYENYEYALRKDGISEQTIVILDKVSKIKSELRTDISKLSDDLKITRRVRKSDKDQSVLTYIEDLKKKAREFYNSSMLLIFCPKCNTWIASIWSLFPEDSHNKITLVCSADYNGEKCGEKITLTTKELLEMGRSNKKDIPESLT